VIAGIDWVTGDHSPGPRWPTGLGVDLGRDGRRRPQLVASGVTSLAAGSGSLVGIPQDACTTSPARVSEAMTVSATNKKDKKPFWANYGDCVDWFAPGVGVTSAWKASDTATNTLSGTSMAAPHTTGVAALYLQSNPAATPAQVRDALFAKTTKGVVQKARSGNNHLLFTDY
jgi:subtilisin family serine protease